METQRRRRCGRSGFSLIEMLTVIMLIAVMLGIFSSLIFSMSRMQRGIENQRIAQFRFGELAELFRKDVHNAISSEFTATGPRFQSSATTPDVLTTVEYRQGPAGLLRIVEERPATPANAQPNVNVKAKVKSQWLIPLAPGNSFAWEQQPLTISKTSTSTSKTPRTLVRMILTHSPPVVATEAPGANPARTNAIAQRSAKLTGKTSLMRVEAVLGRDAGVAIVAKP